MKSNRPISPRPVVAPACATAAARLDRDPMATGGEKAIRELS